LKTCRVVSGRLKMRKRTGEYNFCSDMIDFYP
jgi:hypothetical protein